MKVKLHNEDKTTLIADVEGAKHTVPNLVRVNLWEDKDVTFAAYEKRHPLVGTTKILVKAKDPEASLKRAVKRTVEQVKEFREAFDKSF